MYHHVTVFLLGESCISPALIMATSNDKSYNVLPPIPSKVQVFGSMLVIVSLTSNPLLTSLSFYLCMLVTWYVYYFFRGLLKSQKK